jgi:ATP phosphoribosyltransferase
MKEPGGTMAEQRASLKLALPKGRMHHGVMAVLSEAGIRVEGSSRGYRPTVSLPGIEAKILKPQNIIEMLAHGSRDLGFAGADWVAELGADLVELVDTGLDPVRLVVAAPPELVRDGQWPDRPLVVASEYPRLTEQWIADQGLQATCVRTFGATEVFPPEDADAIVDVAASGATLRANGLVVVAEIMTSSTRLYASPAAMADPARRERLESLALMVRSVLAARERVLVEVNVPEDRYEAVAEVLPAMSRPTVSPLHGGGGYAVKASVPLAELALIIPEVKRRGGRDVVVTKLMQLVP